MRVGLSASWSWCRISELKRGFQHRTNRVLGTAATDGRCPVGAVLNPKESWRHADVVGDLELVPDLQRGGAIEAAVVHEGGHADRQAKAVAFGKHI